MGTRLRLSEAENLAETLDVGNFTTDGQQIEAQNGSGFLNLRFTNKDNYACLGIGSSNVFLVSMGFDTRQMYFADIPIMQDDSVQDFEIIMKG